MDETAEPHLAMISDKLSQTREGRRAGTPRIHQSSDAAGCATLIGLRPHIMCVNECMSVNVDKPRTDNFAADINDAHRFCLCDPWRDSDDLAFANSDIGFCMKRPAWI